MIRGAVLAVVLLGLVAGCSDGDPPAAPRSDAAVPRHLDLGASSRITLGREPNPAAVSDGRLIFPAASRPGRDEDTVYAVDLRTQQRVTLARTSFPAGFINWAVASGDWTVFVEQSAVQSDDDPDVLWRVVAVDRSSDRRRVLASNGAKPDPFVPVVHASDGLVYWTSAEPDKTARESVWTPGSPSVRTLLQHAALTPGTESVAGGWMYYVGPARTTGKSKRASDCWRVPVAGGTPEALTDSGRVMDCVSDGDWLAWSVHIDPDTASPPEDGIGDDPYELWAARVGGTPQLIHRGYFSSSTPYLFRGYLVWHDGDYQPVVTSLANPTAEKTLAAQGSVQTAAGDGDDLVLFTDRDSDRFFGTVFDVRQFRVR